jgi:hypothetical protein
MGRGSNSDATIAAATRKPAITAQEQTTLWTLCNLALKQPEASGFSLVEIAEARLPELSPKEREGFFRVIAETADSLAEKDLAECSSTTDSAESVEWSITAEGKDLVIAAEALKRLRIPELGAP